MHSRNNKPLPRIYFTEKPNGVITQYIVHEGGSDFPLYTGMGLQFVYLRLQPYTNYSLRLEVCTSAGCVQGPWQTVTTAEILPDNQPAPVVGEAGSTTVTLRFVLIFSALVVVCTMCAQLTISACSSTRNYRF